MEESSSEEYLSADEGLEKSTACPVPEKSSTSSELFQSRSEDHQPNRDVDVVVPHSPIPISSYQSSVLTIITESSPLPLSKCPQVVILPLDNQLSSEYQPIPPPSETPSSESQHIPPPSEDQHVPPPSETQHVPPPYEGQHMPPPSEDQHVPPPSEGQHVPPPSETQHVPPPSEGQHVPPPSEGQHVPPPSEDQHVPPPSEGQHVPPPSEGQHVPPPSEGQHVPPPSEDQHVPPPSEGQHVPPPSEGQHVPPPSEDQHVPPPSEGQHVPPPSEGQHVPPPSEGQHVPPPSEDQHVPPPSEDQHVPSLSQDPPIPPPRRKRKKKPEKRPSLENLSENDGFMPLPRCKTISGSDIKKELGNYDVTSLTCDPGAAEPSLDSNVRTNVECVASTNKVSASEASGNANPNISVSSSDGQQGTDSAGVGLANVPISSSLLRDPSSRSRSVTPTPAISIEPDVGLEWTADMLSIPESEVVTSETSLAKARGSTTTSSAVFPSDDDSLDGDLVFADDTAEEEEGGADSEGGDGGDETISPDQSEKSKRLFSPDSDNAILESIMVTNLDTGEVIPLSAAEERIPQGSGYNPLSEHLIQRTKELAEAEGHVAVLYGDEGGTSSQHRKPRIKTFSKLKKWGRKRERGDPGGIRPSEEPPLSSVNHFAIKYKQSSHKQTNQEFDRVRLKQDLMGTHIGAIWTMEFSICGRLLATAGQDSVVSVWVLTTAAVFFHDLQSQYQRLGVHSSVDSLSEKASVASGSSKSSEEDDLLTKKLPFQEYPLCSYRGHTADVLDLSWSKNFFLLSSSMDKTVRLWHISRKECLCCFQHVDFVTAIAFHPRDDRYFLSGSLDGKLRLWNIPDKRVALWNEIEGVGSHLITAANFCMNGKLAVVGTYDGRCIFYDTEHLKYHTQIHVKSRHGKNKGRKISGVEPLPGEDKLLVTSNDSRIRLYNLEDHELSCKYKGCINTSSQIKATFSRDGQYIISGSEDNFVYIWKTHLDLNKLSSGRRDRNEFYESFSSHTAPVTTAVFAPVPGITVDEGLKEVGEIVVAADYQGSIKIYVSGEKL